MADDDPRRTALFEDLANAAEGIARTTTRDWLATGTPDWLDREDHEARERLAKALDSEDLQAALERVLIEDMWTLLHSVFVAIEGGTSAAEVVSLDLVDDKNVSLGPGLNERFVGYLFETGRKR